MGWVGAGVGGVQGSLAALSPTDPPSSPTQVAIKIIDKTQLNPTSLQKVGGWHPWGVGHRVGGTPGHWGRGSQAPPSTLPPTPPASISHSSSGKFVS